MIIFIVPKNSGLEICNNIVSDNSKKIIKSRGEDVPRFVEKLIDSGKNVIGITGADLFEEFVLNNKDSKIEILQKIQWNDKNTMFGKPTLCLLGPKNKTLKDLPSKLRICINKKYEKMADRFIANLKYSEKIEFEKIYLSGATEETFVEGISDLVIDIVYSGKSIKEAGLEVYEKIFESDIVIVGKRKEKILYKDNKFDLKQLYNKIIERMNSNDEKSYTKKLKNNPNFLRRKIVEEAAEVITEDPKNKIRLTEEVADLFYNVLVYMAINGIDMNDIEEENFRRNK